VWRIEQEGGKGLRSNSGPRLGGRNEGISGRVIERPWGMNRQVHGRGSQALKKINDVAQERRGEGRNKRRKS